MLTLIIILSVLVILLGFLVLIYVTKSGVGKEETTSISQLPEISQTQKELREKKKVTLFFLSERDDQLHSEEREIYVSTSVIREAKQVIEELIKGSMKNYLSPLPSQTELRELFLTRAGVAYLDFSEDFQEEHPSGSSAEISTVYSIANSLIYNFKPIKRVLIMIEGAEKETLGGHINLSLPLLPKFNLIAK